VTINDVLVESSVDGEPWTPAQPVDGGFDSPDEAFTLDLAMIAAGNHHVRMRARNSAGGVSDVASFNAVLPDPIDGGLDTRLEPPVAGMPGGGSSTVVRGEASSLNADGTPGPVVTRVEYRVDGGAWQAAQPQDGAFDSADEAFAVPLALQSGTHLVEARAIDVTGKIEQHLASQSISIDRYGVFIPLIQK
jgi:hypothetical protein